MAEGAAVALVGGTVLEVVGQQREAKARSQARIADADNKRRMALEILDRNELTSEQLRLDAQQLKSDQLSAAIALGAGEGTTLKFLEDTQRKLMRQIMINQKESEFRAEQLERGAQKQVGLAREERRAGRLRSGATILRAAGTFGTRGT